LQSGLIFERARKSLLKLEDEVYHPKNWRPIVMALSGTGWTRPHIPIYGHWLTSGHGILTLAHVVTGDLEELIERRARYEKSLRAFIVREELEAFPAVACADFLSNGVEALIQCHGIGGLRPNTVLLGWPNDESKAETFGSTVRLIARTKRSILAARFLSHREDPVEGDAGTNIDEHWDVPTGTIDVWWRGMENGELMLLLAHLLHRNSAWRDNSVRVLRVVHNEQGREEITKHMLELATAARIKFETHVVVSREPVAKVIGDSSRDASLVLLGFTTPNEGEELAMFHTLEEIAGELPRVILVSSAGGMTLES
jgi:hypothetical protein